jgi:hypothetical protein
LVRFFIQIENLACLAGVQMGEQRAQALAVGEGNERREIADRVSAWRLDLNHFHA